MALSRNLNLWTTWVFACLLTALPFSVYGQAQDVVTFVEETFIAAQDASYDNKHIVIDGAVVTIDGEHRFLSLRIVNQGILTHTNGQSLSLEVSGELVVEQGSSIDVSGKGLLADDDAGRASGGSHGGLGGQHYDNELPSEVYGNYQEPITAGLGGRSNSTSGGGTIRGGGAIKLVADSVLLNGQILANGESSSIWSNGGGAGGSIWLDVNSLVAGSEQAVLHANGGDNHDWYYGFGAGGGGGRIALYYEQLEGLTETDTHVLGGISRANHLGIRGGAGTVYLKDKTGTVTHPLRIKGFGSGDAYAKTPLDNLASEPHLIIEDAVVELLGVETLSSIIESRGSDIHVNNALTLDVAVSLEDSSLYLSGHAIVNSSLSAKGSGIHIIGDADVHTELNLQNSSLSVSGDLTLTEVLYGNSPNISTIDVGGQLTVPNNELVVDGIMLSLAQDHEFASIVIKNNGVLTTPVASEHFLSGITLTADSITVEEGSRIDVSGKGLLADDEAGAIHTE